MRWRSHPPGLVVWSSRGTPEPPRRVRPGRIRRRLRTGALLALVGLVWLARTARSRWQRTVGLTGGALAMIGVTLPSGAVLVAGIVVLLVTLLLPSDPDSRSGRDAGWPRCWAEPCLPFFAPRGQAGRQVSRPH